jgi:hypothetical protein
MVRGIIGRIVSNSAENLNAVVFFEILAEERGEEWEAGLLETKSWWVGLGRESGSPAAALQRVVLPYYLSKEFLRNSYLRHVFQLVFGLCPDLEDPRL